MKGLLIRLGTTGVAVLLASQIVPGIEVRSLPAGVSATLLLAFLNALVRPILYFLSLPLIIFTLGLFILIVNAVLLQLVAWLVKGFEVSGFWPSFWGALLISLVSAILNLWVSERGEFVLVHRERPRMIH